jgi:hypothetical protein
MNEREFVAGGMAAVVAPPARAQAAGGTSGHTSLQGLLSPRRVAPRPNAEAPGLP